MDERKIMFIQLSDHKKILSCLQSLSNAELSFAIVNLTKMIASLSIDARELLANRRNYGRLLSSDYSDASTGLFTERKLSTLLTCEQQLTNAINTLCLTEAIIVRDHFSYCLETIAEQGLPAQVKPTIVQDTPSAIRKNNISSIRLAKIKQKLAQAVKTQQEKQELVKNKLNKLLIQPATITSNITSKEIPKQA